MKDFGKNEKDVLLYIVEKIPGANVTKYIQSFGIEVNLLFFQLFFFFFFKKILIFLKKNF